MPRPRLSILALSALAASACLALATGSRAEDAEVSAGRYVATVAGCASCHTAEGGAPFAGGLVLQTPFGPLATSNITQDRATGIGTFTKTTFENALRRGLNKDGQPLYPGMPYLHYTQMTDTDLDALWAYMQTIAPVTNAVTVNRLPFPFDVRASLYVWRKLYFKEGRFEPVSDKSAAWNRGAYLVDALGHCSSCHTPRGPLGGPIPSRRLQGALIEEWYAPNISNGPQSVIADWDVARLEAFLAGNDGMNHVAVGTMRQVVEDLATVTEADRHAIAVYLKDQPAPPTRAPEAAPEAAPPTVAEGRDLFANNCATCHGADGRGAPGVAASLVGSGAVVAEQADNVISVLLEGIGPSEDRGVMPSFRHSLTNEEIAAVADYVRTTWGNDAPANASVSEVARLRETTASDPRALAAAICPNVPLARVGEKNRAALADLVASKRLDSAKVEAVVTAYRAKNPDASMGQLVTDLSGVYCQAVAKSGADRTAVAARELPFMEAVVDLAVVRAQR